MDSKSTIWREINANVIIDSLQNVKNGKHRIERTTHQENEIQLNNKKIVKCVRSSVRFFLFLFFFFFISRNQNIPLFIGFFFFLSFCLCEFIILVRSHSFVFTRFRFSLLRLLFFVREFIDLWFANADKRDKKKRKRKISLKRDAIKTKTIIIAWGPFLLLFLWYRPRCVYFGSILCNAITTSLRSVDRPQTSCRFLIEIWRRSIWHAQFRCEMKTIQLTCFHNKHTIIHSFDRFNWTLLFWPIEKWKKTKKYIEF